MPYNPRPTSRPAPQILAGRTATQPLGALTLPLLLVLILALVAAAIAAVQLEALETNHLPALQSAQQLHATASVTTLALQRADLNAADTLADRFHLVASGTRANDATDARMRSYDASFVDYYVSARRAAQGTSMSDEPDLSSAEAARLARGVLTERLDTGIAAERSVVSATSIPTVELRLALSLLVAFGAGLTLVVLGLRRRPVRAMESDAPVARVVEVVDSAEQYDGNRHLQEAVRRMAERRKAVAEATAQVAERNRQQIALLQAPEKSRTPRNLTVIRGDSQVLRTRLIPFELGTRAAVGA